MNSKIIIIALFFIILFIIVGYYISVTYEQVKIQNQETMELKRAEISCQKYYSKECSVYKQYCTELHDKYDFVCFCDNTPLGIINSKFEFIDVNQEINNHPCDKGDVFISKK